MHSPNAKFFVFWFACWYTGLLAVGGFYLLFGATLS